MKKKGEFVISLDYEIHWGVFDAMSLEQYRNNLNNVNIVVDRLLALSEKYEVKLTFATVGMLFANSKKELEKYNPTEKPTYINNKLDTYELMLLIGENENQDKLHYAQSTINKIAKSNLHEIGTHTYSHYNCLAEGQTLAQFEADIKAANEIAKSIDIEVKSIVFPKNQVNEDYLKVCINNGITSYRGTEKSTLYNTKEVPFKKWLVRFIRLGRLLDSYINLTGHNTCNVKELNMTTPIVNLPSSRFLRPFNPKLKFFEKLKISRVKKSMKFAAKNGQMFHLWWHPHNFGANIDENFKNLEAIFQFYVELKDKYGFESKTMTQLTNEIKSS